MIHLRVSHHRAASSKLPSPRYAGFLRRTLQRLANRRPTVVPDPADDRASRPKLHARRGPERDAAVRPGRPGAGVHARAASPAETDWQDIAALYAYLMRLRPSPVIELNHAVAVAMARDCDDRLGNVWARFLPHFYQVRPWFAGPQGATVHLVGLTTKAQRFFQADPPPFFASPTWRITILVPFS